MKTVLFLIVVSSLSVACSPSEYGGDGLPPTLRVGVVPGQSSDELSRRYAPLLVYLSETLGISCELVLSESYEDFLARFGRGEIDLANFGGVTFVQAHRSHGAVPVVTRDIDRRFTSYILVNADSRVTELADLEGARFGFGSRSSTSGHFMPRYFLEQAEIVLEEVFESVEYLGTHDAVALGVQEGTVDAGAVNAYILDLMISDGRIDQDRVRVLWETPAYVNYVWAIQPSFSRETLDTIRGVFFALSKQDERQADLLDRLGANYFLPASLVEYRSLIEIVDRSDLAEVQ